MTTDQKTIVADFQQVVNMSSKEIERWLATKESQSVGQKQDENESIGHQSGKKIIQILDKKTSDYTDDDMQHMQRVVSYVRRHSAQKPEGDIEHSRWRYSLMNWGHDPLNS
ncbi:DUF3140 domain-containing protein [Gloeobacter morelensis]|uniref:DUF3140 domain-containing protein n=1 Tax=Gloeobacter morelensis MG652769 TaxID=2781736 RepID=A0ABY3PNB2_9CYAN|nr:DUF3140 domain-containing protein [Gloeobacter morelensis]UFP95104.1 DUF3140 domain-containing protein [Gloeobacter morelensis MG652769]